MSAAAVPRFLIHARPLAVEGRKTFAEKRQPQYEYEGL